MGDYDNNNDSGGILGTIFGLILLAILWPYLLALLGLFIAYVVLVAIFNWVAENLTLSILILLGCLGIVCVLRYRLVPKIYRHLFKFFAPGSTAVSLAGHASIEGLPNLAECKFIPSTNLYCYWCTKKLGMKAWEKNGNYYCDGCSTQ